MITTWQRLIPSVPERMFSWYVLLIILALNLQYWTDVSNTVFNRNWIFYESIISRSLPLTTFIVMATLHCCENLLRDLDRNKHGNVNNTCVTSGNPWSCAEHAPIGLVVQYVCRLAHTIIFTMTPGILLLVLCQQNEICH